MKAGKTLQELSAELIRQNRTKSDFLAQSKSIRVMPVESEVELRMGDDGQTFGITKYAHSQLASLLSIPKQYYDRMKATDAGLLSLNVNAWLQRSDSLQMVRTLDGSARAFLSDKYRPLDNYDLATALLPALETSGAVIESCDITETKFYLKAVRHASHGLEVKKGDVVKSGIVISNSEVGAGSLKIEPLIYRLVCLNGAIAGTTMRKYHAGRRGDIEGESVRFLSEETRRQDDRAFWMKVRDLCKAALNDSILADWVSVAQRSLEDSVQAPVAVVQVIAKDFGLSESESNGVVEHLASGGDLTRYGLANAVTRFSQDVDDYDRATELERIGGQVFELPRANWEHVSNRAKLLATA